MPEPPPLGLVCHQQYPGRKRGNIFAPDFCTKKALQYQWPKFGAEFLSSAPVVWLGTNSMLEKKLVPR
jgi:hypothetical protein